MSGPRHGGLIALRLEGLWRGLLIEGPSGAGKSDLILRALGEGFRLVADDRVIVWASGGVLYGRAPETLENLIEVRGVGVSPQPAIRMAPIVARVRCVGAGAVERYPEPRSESLEGVASPVFDLWPFEPSAPLKLRRIIQHLGARP